MSNNSDFITCATIKWGDLYSAADVNKLFNAVKRNSRKKIRFYCMTESREGLDPDILWLPLVEQSYEKKMLDTQKITYHKRGALRKIALFNPEIYQDLDDVVLVLDVDVLIVKNIDELLDHAPGQVVMRKPFGSDPKPFSFGQGSIIKVEPKRHDFLYQNMKEMTEKMVFMANGSEQSYTSISAAARGLLSFYPDAWIVSFKYHCRPKKPLNLIHSPRLPDEARIVCFHGKPDIKEAVHGYRGKFWERTKPASWIQDHWG